jgi:hypothetical protein
MQHGSASSQTNQTSECLMIYRGPGSSPTPSSPLPPESCLSLVRHPVCRRSSLLTEGRGRIQITKVHVYKSTTEYVPSSELGLSHPLSRQRVCPSPRNQRGGGGGAHSPAGEGLGESQFRRLEKKLSTLPTL